jgi:hypothetical protein
VPGDEENGEHPSDDDDAGDTLSDGSGEPPLNAELRMCSEELARGDGRSGRWRDESGADADATASSEAAARAAPRVELRREDPLEEG